MSLATVFIWAALGFYYSGIASGYWGWPVGVVDKQALIVAFIAFAVAVLYRKGER